MEEQTFTLSSLLPALPEVFVLLMIVLIIIVSLLTSRIKSYVATYYLSQITLLGAAGLTIYLYPMPDTLTFEGMFFLDKLASLSKLFIYLTSFFAFLFAR